MKKLLILAAFFASFGVAQSLPYFYCADAGSTDDYACNLTPYTPAAYVTGGFYSFKANTANTGAATVNFNSLGAKTVVKVAGGITTALATNDIRVGQYIVVQYDGTNMQMQSALGNAPAVTSVNGGTGAITTASYGVIGSIPSCTSATSGFIYKISAGLYSEAICDGSSWRYYANGQVMTLPPATGTFSSIALTTETFSTVSGALFLSAPYTTTGGTPSSTNTSYKYIAEPSTPVSITIGIVPQQPTQNFHFQGLGFSDGTKLVNCFYVSSATNTGGTVVAYTQSATTSTTQNVVGTNIGQLSFARIGLLYLKVVDDGTNLTCGFSVDNKQTFTTVYSALRGAYLTTGPSRVGLTIQNNDSSSGSPVTSMNVLSWEQGTN